MVVLKRILKRGAQVALAKVAPIAWRFMDTASLIVLTYHRVLPKGDQRLLIEQPGMWVHPDTFRMHVRILKQHFEVVRLSEWLAHAARNDPLPAAACAITFDDGWRDNYEYAYPILAEEAVSATIFLVADMVGTNAVFWPERLASLLRLASTPDGRARARKDSRWLAEVCPLLSDGRPLSIDSIDAAINCAKARYVDQALNAMLDDVEVRMGLRDQYTPRSIMNWNEVREMASAGVIDIGSHTRTHTRMSADMDEGSLRDEIAGSKRVLEERSGTPVDLFCYPNGDVTASARALVQANYRGACSTQRGWHMPTGDAHAIRRIGIHEDVASDRAAFLSRVSTWL